MANPPMGGGGPSFPRQATRDWAEVIFNAFSLKQALIIAREFWVWIVEEVNIR